MQTNPESAAVEAVARLDITAHGCGEWSAHESEEGMFILYAQHQSALDAMRGEVERLRSQLSTSVDLHGRNLIDMARERNDESDRANAAERRVAELEDALSDAEGRLYRLDIRKLDAGDRHKVDVLVDRLQTTLTKESP